MLNKLKLEKWNIKDRSWIPDKQHIKKGLYFTGVVVLIIGIVLLILYLAVLPVMKKEIVQGILTGDISLDGEMTATTVDVENQYAGAGLETKVSECITEFFSNTEAEKYLTPENVDDIANIIMKSFEESGYFENSEEIRNIINSELQKLMEEKNITDEERFEIWKKELLDAVNSSAEFSQSERDKLIIYINEKEYQAGKDLETLKSELIKELQSSQNFSESELAKIKDQLAKLESDAAAKLDDFKNYMETEVVPEINTIIQDNSQKIENNSTSIAENTTNIVNIANDVSLIKNDITTIYQNLGGCSIVYDGEHFYVTGGADSALKKIGLCSVILNTNAGADTVTNELEVSVVSRAGGAFVIEPADTAMQPLLSPLREGWTFAGWTDDAGTVIEPLSVYHQQTLYASWVDDISPSLEISATNNIDSIQTATLTMSDRGSGVAAYYFGTQNPETEVVTFTPFPDITTDAYADVTVPDAGMYYFACKDAWDNVTVSAVNFYAITLDLDGGTGVPEKIIGMENSSIVLPDPEKTGYTFIEWEPDEESVTFDRNKGYKATYEINSYVLTFDANKGVCDASPRTIIYNEPYGELPTAEREYYDFLGWYTTPDGGQQVTEETRMGAGDTTIYAHWKSRYITVNTTDYTGVYDGAAHQAVVSSDIPDVTFRYGTAEGSYTSNTMPVYTNAGTYMVYWEATHPDFLTTTGTVTVMIEKAQATISLDTSKGYIAVTTNSDGVITASSSDLNIVDRVNISGKAVKVLPKNHGNAGTVNVTVTINEAANYKAVSAVQSVTISSRLIPGNLGWWNPSGTYEYGYLISNGSYKQNNDSMWKTTADVSITEPGFYYILGYSGSEPRFCLYTKPGSNGSNLDRALTATEGYAVQITGTRYLKLSVCVGAGYTVADCDLRKITFN